MRSWAPTAGKTSRGRLVTLLVALGFAAALACNYPAFSGLPTVAPASPLQLTLEAMGTAAPGDSLPPSTGELPAPGNSDPFPGLMTATPGGGPPTPPAIPATPPENTILYLAQSGDTLPAVADRFDVLPGQITSPDPLPDWGFLVPGQLLLIPHQLGEIRYPDALLPDSEVIDSPSTVSFNLVEYIQSAAGFLSTYTEVVDEATLTGEEIVGRVALETSANPRLLLAFLEYRSQWVRGQPSDPEQIDYPIGFYASGYTGLYRELTLVANHLNIPYYDWRRGRLRTLTFKDGSTARISPALNAGSVALQVLFSKFYEPGPWHDLLYGPGNFLGLHQEMFGDPWLRAAALDPTFHPALFQPVLELPFLPGEQWSFTGGPHRTLNLGSPLGALDFSPVTGQPPCAVSTAWVTASASGVVTRSRNHIVTIDLDGDGFEQTGWVLFYLHLADHERVPEGVWVNVDAPLGHPSCEGGSATGTHVHMARKYNGEWIAADGPLPFVLSGWSASMGARAYEGTLTKGDQVVSAHPGGPGSSAIQR